MSEFYRGLTIAELQEQFVADEASLPPEQLRVRYGTDKPRFMGLGGRTGRINSTHLRSPMWVDRQGREYTPEEQGATAHWWVRIPNSVTIRARKQIDSGEVAPSDAPGFPEPGDVLQLQRVYSGVDPRQAEVRVEALIAPKKASAELFFESELDATWSDREREFMRRKADTQQRKRGAPQEGY